MDTLARAKMLLEITERAALHSGKFTAITGAAMDELLRINEELRQDAMAKAEAAKPVEQPVEDEVDLFDDDETDNDDNIQRRL